ncbi:MAG: type II secretion system F family protein, partial [Myxococcales bacterium]|nr:type II secretion system F family protein [Myxococcales bacterium]
MNLFVLMAAASVFFTLQALYWIVVSRKGSKQALLAERLGTDESLSASAALMRRENEGALAQSLAQLLEEAGEETSLGPFLVRVGLWFFIVFTLVLLITGSLGAAMVMGMAGTVLPYLGLLRKRRKRVQRIEEQLPEALEVMIISLRAGQSLDQTIRLTASELDAPIGDEFHRVSEEVQLGRPLEEALVAMSARLAAARTVRTFVTSVLVLRQTGGNLIEVLEQI